MRKVRAVLLPTGDLDCRFQSVNDARTRSELLANLPLPLDLFVPEKADRLRSALVTAHRACLPAGGWYLCLFAPYDTAPTGENQGLH